MSGAFQIMYVGWVVHRQLYYSFQWNGDEDLWLNCFLITNLFFLSVSELEHRRAAQTLLLLVKIRPCSHTIEAISCNINIFCCEGDCALAHVAQRGCGFPILGCVQKPRDGPGWMTAGDPAWAEGLNVMISRGSFNLIHSLILTLWHRWLRVATT